MSSEMIQNRENYYKWLGELKTRFRQVQLKAAVTVNTTLLQFYWELGTDIVARQAQVDWGSGFLKQLSTDLMLEFPEMKGFSVRNLKYIRQWHAFWLPAAIGQQPVAQLAKQPVSQIFAIPWGHNLTILAKCKQREEALYYVERHSQTDGYLGIHPLAHAARITTRQAAQHRATGAGIGVGCGGW